MITKDSEEWQWNSDFTLNQAQLSYTVANGFSWNTLGQKYGLTRNFVHIE